MVISSYTKCAFGVMLMFRGVCCLNYVELIRKNTIMS